jgi:hypothetical protein
MAWLLAFKKSKQKPLFFSTGYFHTRNPAAGSPHHQSPLETPSLRVLAKRLPAFHIVTRLPAEIGRWPFQQANIFLTTLLNDRASTGLTAGTTERPRRDLPPAPGPFLFSRLKRAIA